MRVALFTETFLPKIDGIVTVVCLLLDHLEQHGIETVVVAPKMGVERYNRTPIIGVPGVTLPLYPELKVGPPTLSTYSQLKAFQPDVAHFIHPALIGVGGLMMAKWLNVPTVASFHLDLARLVHHFNIGFMEPVTDWFTKTVFNQADYTLAPSRLIQQEMLELGVRNVGLWKRGVDAERFNPRYRSAEMRSQLSTGHPEDVVLLYVGRLSSEKQIDQLKYVLEAVPNTRLALVGDGPARDDLKAHFAGTNTTFMGYLKGEALSQAYASADIFVFPSALETFGLVVVEAMAAGLPVVSSRVGGVRDLVVEGRTGYTFDVGDIAGLVAGVRQTVTSRENIAAMGQAARAFAETQTWPAMMDEVIDLYVRLIMARKEKGRLMAFQDFKDPHIAQQWDADTLTNNPSRPEQLDMLLTLLEAEYQPGKTIIDLGIGTGLIEEMLFRRIPAAQVVGVDASAAMMARAHERLDAFSAQYVTLEHDFTQIQSLQLPPRAYQFAVSVQTLHHLTDEQMQNAYHFIFNLLESDGLFLLLDRIAVEKSGLFRCYQTLWQRQDRLYGSKVASAEGQTVADHTEIVRARGDLPMGLERHLQLLQEVGFEAACLHLQTNRVLIAARKP